MSSGNSDPIVTNPCSKNVNFSFSNYEWLFLALPGVVGFMSSFLFPIKSSAGASIPARPPSVVFIIAWIINYIILGLVWAWSSRDSSVAIHILMASTLFTQFLWTIFYNLGFKRAALYVLLIVLIIALMTLVFVQELDPLISIVSIPYVVWIFFATLLNYSEVNQKM